MKKALSLTAIALSAVILFAGCSFGRSEIKSADDRSSESKSEEFEEMLISRKLFISYYYQNVYHFYLFAYTNSPTQIISQC